MLEFLLKIVIGSVVILVVPLLAEPFLRKARPETRHTLWIAALAGLFVFPFLAPLLPSVALVTHVTEMPMQVEPIPSVDLTPAMPKEPFAMDFPVSAAVSDEKYSAPETEADAEAAPFSMHWAVVLSVVWLAGAAFWLVRLLVSFRTLRKIETHAQEESDTALLNLLESVRREFGISRSIKILRSEAVHVPFASGIFRSIIFLPLSFTNPDGETLRSVLMHETAHIRRRDPLWQLFTQLARILYWFQPLVYVAGNRIRSERELACDRTVLESHTDAEQYASVLLDMNKTARSQGNPYPSCAVAMASMHPLERRIRAILDFRPGSSTSRWAAFLVVLLMVLTTAVAATLTPTETVEKKTQKYSEREAVSQTSGESASETFLTPGSEVESAARIAVPVHVDLPEGVIADEVEIYATENWKSQGKRFIHANYAGPGFTSKPHLNLRPDRKYVVWACAKKGGYVSELVPILIPRGASLDFTLFEGVPLTGTLKYRDGKPVADYEVRIFRMIQGRTPEGAERDIPFSERTLEFSRSVKTDKQGNYSIALPPGVYEIRVLGQWETDSFKHRKVILKEGQKVAADFTIRDAFYVRLLHADGRPVFDGSTPYVLTGFTWREGFPPEGKKGGALSIGNSLTINWDGNIRMIPFEKSNFLHFVTKDGKEGVLKDFSSDIKSGEVVDVRLEPTVRIKSRWIRRDTDGPVADTFLRCPVSLRIPNMPASFQPVNVDYTTDKNGNVTVCVPALGKYVETEKLTYSLNFHVEGSTGIMFNPNMFFAPTTPGEEIDLGVFEILFRPQSGGKTLTRTVLLPDGKPAVGATVCLGTADLRLSPPQLLVVADGPSADSYVVARTDENGRFRIPEPGEKEYQICFVHPGGYAQVNNKVFTEKETFTLQEYASLEVRIPYDTKPDARNLISLGQPSTPETRATDMTFQQLEYQSKIPENGIVKIDKIAPGEFNLSKLAMNATDTWFYPTMSVSVKLEPGKATTLDLRNAKSVRVKGRIRLPNDFGGDFTAMDWSHSYINLSNPTRAPEAERRQSYCLALTPSKDDPRVAEFEFDDIAPGRRSFHVTLLKRDPWETIGSIGNFFVIPDSEAEKANAVHDLGTIEVPFLKPALKKEPEPKPVVNEPATKLGFFQAEENGEKFWMIRGRVLDPDGSPARKLNISYRHDGNFYLNKTDENGCFSEKRGINEPEEGRKTSFLMCGIAPDTENDTENWPWTLQPTSLDLPWKQPSENLFFAYKKGVRSSWIPDSTEDTFRCIGTVRN